MSAYDSIEPSGKDTGAPVNLTRRFQLFSKYIDFHHKWILDCGCGTGTYIKKFLEYSPNVYGVEFFEDKVAQYKAENPNAGHVSHGNIENLQFQDETFDFVLLNEVLEHVVNEDQVLKSIWRVLKKGGILALFSPNRLYPFESHGSTWKSSKRFLPPAVPFIPYIPVGIGKHFIDYHARNYFPWELRSLVRKNGFMIEGHHFVWQTFENLSGTRTQQDLKITPLLRGISFTLEKIPGINFFGLSQLIIAKKE